MTTKSYESVEVTEHEECVDQLSRDDNIDDREGNITEGTMLLKPPVLQHARNLIFLSHFVSQFSECAWQFAVVLFLAAVSHYHSITLVSSYYLTTYLALMIGGTPVGLWLDRTPRLQAARVCIWVENTAILIATIFCCWLLTKTERQQDDTVEDTTTSQLPRDRVSVALMVCIHIFGSVAMLLNQGFVVAVERDWIVVLSRCTDNDPEAWLSKTNVALRQIYLACKVLSPSFAGWVISWGQTSTDRLCDMHNAAVFIGVLCVLSLVVEYLCAIRVYNLVPALSVSRDGCLNEMYNLGSKHITPAKEKAALPPKESLDEPTIGKVDDASWVTVYWKQPIVWAGIALAFLNANSLCFGGAMTTYLVSEGMSVGAVGLWRGISSAIGLLGTFAYRWSARHTSVVNTGAWSVVYLFVCLTVACASFFFVDAESNQTPLYFLVSSTAASRIGFWVFDISVTLLYQELVPDGVRSLIGGTQQSLNSVFTMGSGCLGLLYHKPEQYYVIALAGYGGIGISMLLYLAGVYRRGTSVLFRTLDQQLENVG